MQFSVEHLIYNIGIAEYERIFFDETLNINLCNALKLDRTLLQRNITDKILTRSVRIIPDRQIPSPIAKILRTEQISYIEDITYTMGGFEGSFNIISSIMTDKVQSYGTFAFKRQGSHILRVVSGDVKVKIFGVGALVERFIVADIERSYSQAAHFTNQWLAHQRQP